MISSYFNQLKFACQDSKRIERKISLNSGQINYLISTIYELGFSEIFKPRNITSFYFDDSIMSTARDNIDGVQRRLKFRMRYYDGHYMSNSREIKIKDGFIGYKLTNKSSSENSLEDCLKYSGIYFNQYSDSYLKPSAKVKYSRKYFTHPSGVRCTYDTNIDTCRVSDNHFYQGNKNNYEVIEFKYPPELDDFFRKHIWTLLSRYSLRGTKSSKYVRSILP